MDYAKESLRLHYEWKGKLEMVNRAAVDSAAALSLAYTPRRLRSRRVDHRDGQDHEPRRHHQKKPPPYPAAAAEGERIGKEAVSV